MSLIKWSISFWLQNIYAFVLNDTKFNAIHVYVGYSIQDNFRAWNILYVVVSMGRLCCDKMVSFTRLFCLLWDIFLLLGCHPALIWRFLSSLIYLVMICWVGILRGLIFSEGKRSRYGEELSWGMGLGSRRIWERRNWVRDVKYDRRINFKKSEVYSVRY